MSVGAEDRGQIRAPALGALLVLMILLSARLLRRFVFRPLRLRETSLPVRARLPRPFLHGYVTEPGSPPEDVSTLLSFRYRTRCGTVYGHTGNFPGYVQFAAATRDGRRADVARACQAGLARRRRALPE
jgi:hypothetical protein